MGQTCGFATIHAGIATIFEILWHNKHSSGLNLYAKKHLKLWLSLCLVASALPAFAETHFDRVFAPEDITGFGGYEKPAAATRCA